MKEERTNCILRILSPSCVATFHTVDCILICVHWYIVYWYTDTQYTDTLYTETVLLTLVYQLLYTLQWQVTAAFKSSKWLPKIHNTSYLTYSQNSCWQHVKSSF